MQKKNIAAFVCALLGAICGLVGGIIWAACADTCADIVGSSAGYIAGFVILGIGGAVLGLIGGIQALGFKKGRVVLSVLGLALEVGQLILACVFAEGFSFILNLWTLLSIVLLFVTVLLVFIKKDGQQ